MTRMRVWVIAGSAVAAMMAADASAQDCPEWLKWACASSTAAAREGQEKQLSRTKATAGSPMHRRSKQARTVAEDSVTTPKSQQTRAPERARPAKTARHTPSGDRRSAQHEERQGSAMTDQQKEELFHQFLEWKNARRLNAETNR
jgi:hypothetical protein